MSTSSLSPSPSPLLLYAVSFTFLITLSVLPLYLSPQLIRSFRSQRVNNYHKSTIVLALASTTALVLYGVCGLAGLSNGGVVSAVAGGIFGALSLVIIDVQAILSVLWVQKFEISKKESVYGLTAILGSLLLVAAVLQIVLLSLDQPSKGTLFGLAHARGIFHLAFDLVIVGILCQRLLKITRQSELGQDVEADDSMTMVGLSEIKGRSDVATLCPLDAGSSSAGTTHQREFSLMALQLLSTLLSILSISFPIFENYLSLDQGANRFVPPSIFGSTSSPATSIVLAAFIVFRWTGNLFELASHPAAPRPIDVESRPRSGLSLDTRDLKQITTPFSPPPTRPSTGTRTRPSTGNSESTTLNTPNAVYSSTLERPLTSRSRSHSASSLLSFAANFPPAIREECERSNQEDDDGSCAVTDSSEDYFHSETFPAPFVGVEQEDSESRRHSRCSQNRPRSASSPEPFYSRPVSPRTPSPVALRGRKDAGRLTRPPFTRSYSSASLFTDISPTVSRPSLNVDVTPDESYHSAVSVTPARSQQGESGRSTPSPTKSRRPSLRSLVGISTPRRIPSGDSPTNYRGMRRGSRSSSISFLRGNEPVTPTLEIETDEDDPFAAVQASQAIEATKKVEEWARRKASEKEMLSTEGGFEEDIENVSPTRSSFERLGSPIRVTTSALAQLSDPSLHPRRAPSSSNSLFHEHLFSLPDSHDVKLDQNRSRSGSLGSAITLGSTANVLTQDSTTSPYRFGKSISPSSPSSPPSTSSKLLEVMGIRSSPNLPPRADSFSSRPLSSQVEKKEESEEQVRARTRSSAPPPSSPSSSPRVSPVRRLFARRPSATGRLFSSSPPTINYPSPVQTRKSSRASSTFSTASFSLSKLRRGSSNSGLLKPSVTKLAGGGGTLEGSSQVSSNSFRRSASSDLSFMCRGEGGSSYQSSLRQSIARSASLDFQIGSSSKSSSLSDKAKTIKTVESNSSIKLVASPGSPARTTNWWTQGSFDSRPLTPYRSSPRRRRQRVNRPRSTSAPPSVSPKKHNLVATDSEEEELSEVERPRGRHERSKSLPLNRLSDYQLQAPARISPIGSLFLTFDDDDLTQTTQRTPPSKSLLGPPLVLAQSSSKSTSARSSLSLSLSLLQQDWKGHSRDKTLSEGDLEELSALCETFTPLEISAAPSRSSLTLDSNEQNYFSNQGTAPISPSDPSTPGLTLSSFSPSTFATTSPASWPGAELSTSPTSTESSSVPPSPAISHSSIDYGFSRMSTDSNMVDYWLETRQNWMNQDEYEQECLEGTGEGEQMF